MRKSPLGVHVNSGALSVKPSVSGPITTLRSSVLKRETVALVVEFSRHPGSSSPRTKANHAPLGEGSVAKTVPSHARSLCPRISPNGHPDNESKPRDHSRAHHESARDRATHNIEVHPGVGLAVQPTVLAHRFHLDLLQTQNSGDSSSGTFK